MFSRQHCTAKLSQHMVSHSPQQNPSHDVDVLKVLIFVKQMNSGFADYAGCRVWKRPFSYGLEGSRWIHIWVFPSDCCVLVRVPLLNVKRLRLVWPGWFAEMEPIMETRIAGREIRCRTKPAESSVMIGPHARTHKNTHKLRFVQPGIKYSPRSCCALRRTIITSRILCFTHCRHTLYAESSGGGLTTGNGVKCLRKNYEFSERILDELTNTPFLICQLLQS